MTERAKHGIAERTLVPGTVITAAIDKQGRRNGDTAITRISHIGGNAGFRLLHSRAVSIKRQAESRGNRL